MQPFIFFFMKLLNLIIWFGFSRQQMRHTAAPPPAGVQRRMERKRQKPVGRDQGSLTEQQTKGTGTTTIQIRGKHKTKQTAERAALTDRTDAAAPPHRNPA